ncbi:MAG: DUF5103 domain-containing protein [Bacteroidota bacterium]|nr:DUF5103 domain-containing protein [Bacteroidota bacterium]
MSKKHFLLFCLLLLAFIVVSKLKAADQPWIKSLKVYSNNDEKSLPILIFNEDKQDHLRIEFDIKAPYEPSFNIVFRFCDRNWNPTKNIFYSNFGQDRAYELDFEKLPSTITDADYHFNGTFPDTRGQVSFPFSGKWRLYITDSQDTSIVYASAKFIVVRDTIAMYSSLKKESLEDKSYFPTDLSKVFNLTTSFTLPEDFFVTDLYGIEIIENHKIDYPYFVDRSGNTQNRYYNWDGNRKFSFSSKELRPGKNYRQVDLRNINLFNSKNVNAHLDGVETSRFFTEGKKDLNGASILTYYKDENADYLNVNFRLRADLDYGKKVFIVGAFSNWDVLPEYELKNDGGLYSIIINLKRGAYDYQYVTGYLENGKVSNIDWYELEGNSWSTVNNYYVFLFYSDPAKGGYDRIIGFQKVTSK